MSTNTTKDVKEKFTFPMLFRRRKQLVVWVDADRKVHSNAHGSITAQMKAVSAVIDYLQLYASMCEEVSEKIDNVNHELVEDNIELKRKLKTATNTIGIVEKEIRRKSNRDSKVS